MKTQLSKPYQTQKISSLEGYKFACGKKKNLKQPNLMHKATRERKNKTKSQQKKINKKDKSRDQ